jgi:hypothetical protein
LVLSFAVVAYGGLAFVALMMGAPQDWSTRLFALAAVLIGAITAWGIYQKLQFTWQLRRDRLAGKVRGSDDGERLLYSGLLWTSDGQPAGWRVRYRRAK